MKLRAATPNVPASQNGHSPPDSDISVSHATRYLCAAAHLRRSMLPDEVAEPGLLGKRSPLPVGRSYARRVLFRAEGLVPMSAVDDRRVRMHCRAALLHTGIRDAALIAVLVTSAILEPWGTIITFGLLITVTVLVGRVRLSSPLTIAAAIGVTLGLLTIGSRQNLSLAVPLLGLAACFLIYLADILWSAHHLRRLWRQFSAQPTPQSVAPTPPPEPITEARRQWPLDISSNGQGGGRADLNGQSEPRADLNGQHSNPKAPGVSSASRVYYDKHGIVGAGTSVQALTLTLPLDKPLDEDIARETFSASELLDYICLHLVSQGVWEARVHGYSFGPPTMDDDGRHMQEPENFTYGLPYLDVGRVVAIPVPGVKKRPPRLGGFLPLDYGYQPSADEVTTMTDRSPSQHPERHYVRASTASWDSQLVASIYVNAALQGHFLRVVIRPYVLGPIVSDLKIADELATRHLFIVTCLALRMAIRQFMMAAERLHTLKIKTDTPGATRPGLNSMREYYAQFDIDNIHQREDADRIIDILERKIIGVTMNFLRQKNIDVEEYEERILNQTTIIGDGNIMGTIKNSQVNTQTGQGNTATNTTNDKK